MNKRRFEHRQLRLQSLRGNLRFDRQHHQRLPLGRQVRLLLRYRQAGVLPKGAGLFAQAGEVLEL